VTDPSALPGTILQVISSRGWGGRELLPLAIHRHWIRQGRRARLLVGAGTEMARRAAGDPTIEPLPTGRLSFALALRRRVRRHDPAAILCHFTHDLPSIRIALIGRPGPSLLVVKHLSPGPPKRDLVHRFLYRRVDRLLAVSGYIRAKCLATYPISSERVSVWYPGIDVERFSFHREARDRIRHAASVDDNDYLIGYAARITPRKGFEDLLAMMVRVREQIPRARLWLIGGVVDNEKPYDRWLRDQIAHLGLGAIVHFTGHQERIQDYLCALDLFVTPSQEESFGLTTVEAMATGRPVVGFRAAGTAEIVVDGITGRLADPDGDPVSGLTKSVLQIADEPDRASVMGLAARERAVRMFSQEAMMQRLDMELQS
jgi:glycosyltransferase involved in cell wall biosynthesis